MRVTVFAATVSAVVNSQLSHAATSCESLVREHNKKVDPIISKFLDIGNRDKACNYAWNNYDYIESFDKKFTKYCKDKKGFDAFSIEDDLNIFFEATFSICGF